MRLYVGLVGVAFVVLGGQVFLAHLEWGAGWHAMQGIDALQMAAGLAISGLVALIVSLRWRGLRE